MKKTSILSLSLTAMTFCVSTGLQALTSNYEICFDGRATTTQKNSTNSNVPSSIMLPNNIFISHARCELSGEISDIIVSDLTKNWSYHIELETPGFENSQFNLNPSGWNTALQENGAIPNLSYAMFDPALVSSVFSLAYFSWDCCENVSFMLGKIPCPEITSDRIYYRPYIAEFPTNLASGAIIGYSGNHDGFAMKGQIGAIHYQFGAWRQTLHRGIETFPLTANAITGSANFSAFYTAFIDSSSNISSSANFEAPSSTVNFAGNFDEKNLRIGYSGRLHYSRELFDGLMIGAGLGYLHAPLNAPISIITMGQTYSTSPSQNLGYSVAAFNNLESFACDIQGAYGKAQFNAGYQSQKIPFYTAENYGQATSSSEVFNVDGHEYSYWIEGGYILFGKEYIFDRHSGVVSGVKLNPTLAGLEITARVGYTKKYNLCALLDPIGWNDFSSVTTSAPAQSSTQSMLYDFSYASGLVADAASLLHPVLEIFVDNSANPGFTGTQIEQSADENAFATRSSAWSIGMNYYISENAVWKIEYESQIHKFQRYYTNSHWFDSVNYKSVSTCRIRADYLF